MKSDDRIIRDSTSSLLSYKQPINSEMMTTNTSKAPGAPMSHKKEAIPVNI